MSFWRAAASPPCQPYARQSLLRAADHEGDVPRDAARPHARQQRAHVRTADTSRTGARAPASIAQLLRGGRRASQHSRDSAHHAQARRHNKGRAGIKNEHTSNPGLPAWVSESTRYSPRGGGGYMARSGARRRQGTRRTACREGHERRHGEDTTTLTSLNAHQAAIGKQHEVYGEHGLGCRGTTAQS